MVSEEEADSPVHALRILMIRRMERLTMEAIKAVSRQEAS